MNPPPPPPQPQPFNPEVIDMLWTDEQIIMWLDEYRPGCRHPRNVLIDINPFRSHPENLPEGVYYLLDTEVCRESNVGHWEEEATPERIYSDGVINGWITMSNYFNHVDDNDIITDWMMQEYTVTRSYDYLERRGPLMLCRIFLSDEPQNESPSGSDDDAEEDDNQGFGNMMVEPKPAPLPVAEDEPQPAPGPEAQDEPDDMELFAELQEFLYGDGDFLELADLENEISPPSSCVSSLTSLYRTDDSDSVEEEEQDNAGEIHNYDEEESSTSSDDNF